MFRRHFNDTELEETSLEINFHTQKKKNLTTVQQKGSRRISEIRYRQSNGELQFHYERRTFLTV